MAATNRIEQALAQQTLVKQEQKGEMSFADVTKFLGVDSPRTAKEGEPEKTSVQVSEMAALLGVQLPPEKKEPTVPPVEAKKEEAVPPPAELKKEELPPAPTFTMLAGLKEIFGEVTSEEQLVSVAKKLKEDHEYERAANEEMAQLIEDDPAVKNILADLLEYKESNGSKGRPLLEAFRTHAQIEEAIPDPAEDSDGYARVMEKQVQRREAAKAEVAKAGAARKEYEERNRKATEHAQSLRKKLAESKKLDDAALAEFNKKVARLVQGDPTTGLLPEEVYDVFWNGVNYPTEIAALKAQHEADKKKAVDEALIEERKKLQGLNPKKTDGTPAFDGGRGNQEPPKVKEELAPLVSAAAYRGRFPAAGIPVKR